MAEMPEEKKDGGEAKTDSQLEELKQRVEAAEKRAEAAEKKFEMTKAERAEEREKRQAEAEKNSQLEEYKRIQEEKTAEMQSTIEELTAKVGEVDDLKAKAEQWDGYQKTRRESLVSQLPEDRREKFENAPLDLLEETVSLLSGSKPAVHKGGASKLASADIESLDGLNSRERVQFAKEHPEKFQALVEKGMKERSL